MKPNPENWLVPACLLLLLADYTASAEEAAEPKLFVVHRSIDTRDGLYHCNLEIPKDFPVYSIGLFMKDRQDKKVGEATLGTMEIDGKTRTIFELNHELVKRSVVIIYTHPLDDDRHKRIKFVVGEQGAIQKKDGKTVTLPIE